MANLGTRWQPSDLTFGPVGRLVATAVLLAIPLWMVVRASVFGFAFVGIWCALVLPRALRDVWRRAPLPETDLSRLRDAQRREAQERAREDERGPRTHGVLGDQPPPSRW